MSWVRLDDNFPDHPKVLDVGGECAWLFVCALCYANRHHTNGLIPMSAIPRLVDSESAYQMAKDLVDTGLFEKCDDQNFYLIHDYLEYQPSNEDAEARRIKVHNDRVTAGKQRATSAFRDPAGRFSAGQVQHDQHTSSPDPSPTHINHIGENIGEEPKSTSYPSEFEAFWDAFPKERGNKYPAFVKWEKRIKDGATADSLLLAAKNYAKSRSGEPDKFTKRAQSWLHNRMDEDYQGESGYDDPALKAWL